MNSFAHNEAGKTAVLFIITRMAVGGAPQILLSTVCGLDRSKYNVVLVTGVPGPDEGNLIDKAKSIGIEVRVLPDLQREIHPIRDLRVFYQLLRLIRLGRFHIVHTHLSKAGILGRLAAWWTGAPVIVHTFHGDVFLDYFNPVLSKLFLVAERLAACITNRFTVVSENLKFRLCGYGISNKRSLVVIPNGIQRIETSLSSRNYRESKNLRVGTVAMFYPVKRVDLFLKMAHQVGKRFPQVEFAIAGGGPDDLRLRALSKELGEPVQFHGVCYDIPAFLSTLDLFVLCSDYESAGVAMMEAMMAGLPIVATRVGGVPAYLVEGETGIMVPKGDLNALSNTVEDLLDDYDLRKKLGKSAEIYAKKHLSVDEMVNKLQSLYDTLID